MKLYIMEEVDLDEDHEQVIEEELELTEESEESTETPFVPYWAVHLHPL